MRIRDPKLRSAIAGEFAAGVLPSRIRIRLKRLLETDPALRGEVESWETSLYRLLDALPEREPPPQLWQRIEQSITSHPEPKSERTSIWHSFSFWRGWSLAATAASAVLAAILVLTPTPAAITYVVVVTDDAQGRASWVLGGKVGSQELSVRTLAPQNLSAGRAFQLWVLPAGEKKVRSVGLIPATGRATLTVSEAIAEALADAQKLGVSIEAPGGSPTGQPTTTPLYHGTPTSL